MVPFAITILYRRCFNIVDGVLEQSSYVWQCSLHTSTMETVVHGGAHVNEREKRQRRRKQTVERAASSRTRREFEGERLVKKGWKY